MKYIYIAGPYTKGDVCINVRGAIAAAERLSSYGYIPFIPHLTHFWHMIEPHEIKFWYDYDSEWLRKCDALVRLPGESHGADAEVDLAHELGIPIYFGVMEFITRNILSE